jgi:phosphatidylinositol alpha-1,6-mannosyltransferase
MVTCWLLLLRRVDVVYFSDGVVAAMAPWLRRLFPRPRFVTTVYGLELRYRNARARRLMTRGARTCDRVVVISRNTRAIAADRGIAEDRLRIVYLGVEPTELDESTEKRLLRRFEQAHDLHFGRQRILLNFGRQIPRKGVAEFLERGMPLLDADIRLVIGGRGPELPRIRELARRPELAGRVLVLGALPDDELAMLRSRCDLFIMPNIPLADDVEGFGQTQLECMYAGTPAVAFAVDALTESVREGGYLVPPGDYRAFASRIHEFYALSPGLRRAKEEEARNYVRREYSWDSTTSRYLEIFTGRD